MDIFFNKLNKRYKKFLGETDTQDSIKNAAKNYPHSEILWKEDDYSLIQDDIDDLTSDLRESKPNLLNEKSKTNTIDSKGNK